MDETPIIFCIPIFSDWQGARLLVDQLDKMVGENGLDATVPRRAPFDRTDPGSAQELHHPFSLMTPPHNLTSYGLMLSGPFRQPPRSIEPQRPAHPRPDGGVSARLNRASHG